GILSGQARVEVAAGGGAAESKALGPVERDDALAGPEEIVREKRLERHVFSGGGPHQVLGSAVEDVERRRLGGGVPGHSLRPGRELRDEVGRAHEAPRAREACLAASPASWASCSNSRTVVPVVSASRTTSSSRAAASSGASSAADS